MVIFNGTAKIRVVEARELRPTEWSKRLVLLSQNYQPHFALLQVQSFGGPRQSNGGRVRECGLRRVSHWQDRDPAQNEMPGLERGLPG